jgi:hypothetical protein
MRLDVSEAECEVLEDLLNQTLGNLRAQIDTTSIAELDYQLEQREVRVQHLLAEVASRRRAWRAECASLDGLVGPNWRW